MGSLGSGLFLFGLGSMILNMLDREFILMMWVDNWGTGVGWGIRIGMMIVGAVLWFVGQASDE